MQRPIKLSSRKLSIEVLDKPLGSAAIKFIRSIPLEKAMDSTYLLR
jgi:hypothetical protein